jgi:glycosyltransferase XagB
MTRPEELVRAVLGEFCRSDDDAAAILASARALRVDPLDYCIHRYGLGTIRVLERAADWAGLAFSPAVPSTDGSRVELKRLDGLAETRSIRARLYDREVLYLAPRFEEFIGLRSYVAEHPGMRRTTCIAPASAIRAALAGMSAPQLLDEARQRLARRWPFASADLDLGRAARGAFVGAGATLALLAVLAPLVLQAVLLPLIGLVLIVPALFRLVAVLANLDAAPPEAAPPVADAGLPIYSVLIPLNDEAQMVPLLRRAMTALDYPSEKLDIKFVVEARSIDTVEAVKAVLGDPRFELVTVPDAPPFTKPKALDYALPLVRGAYVVVYDAEDIPNPDQLRLAAAAFAADPGVDCLQAELLVDNARENALTGLFTGEYAGQFGIVLPALARWSMPMPLGGTSNHFRVAALREMGGWDAFNVTEDADLGVRLARLRYRTGMLASQTWEEAPVTLGVWMRQRTRWMKGWMQTFIVHNHQPLQLLRDMGWANFLAFEIYVGSMILSPILHTAFLAGLVAAIAGEERPFGIGDPLSLLEMAFLLIGYGASLALVAAGLLRLGQRRLLLQQALLPAYWVLHTVATFRAGYELLYRPHFWAKTAHGLTRLERSFAPPPDHDRQRGLGALDPIGEAEG